MNKTKRHIFLRVRNLAILMVILSGCIAASAQSVLSFPQDRSASVAVVVRDLATGKDIVSENPHRSMLPASTMKCITMAAAMEAGLDSTYFESEVYITGPIDSAGVLHGNLLIRGNGDPTNASAQFPTNPSFVDEIVNEIKLLGIKEIEGMITIDATNFPDDGPCENWEVADLSHDYGTGLYSLNYRDNSRGSAAMKNPGDVFAETLDNELMANGIATAWDELPNSALTPVCTHRSPIGAEIMHNLMVRSDNLFAEGMLRKIAPGQSRAEAIKKERQLLSDKGINFDVTEIYDGSGLSRLNRVTAAVMADILQTMATKHGRDVSYPSLFPKVGKEGTVKSLLDKSPLEGRLVLKSGSMNGVHCYAGYKIDDQGIPTHAVVILVNDFHCARGHVRSAIETFLTKTFE